MSSQLIIFLIIITLKYFDVVHLIYLQVPSDFLHHVNGDGVQGLEGRETSPEVGRMPEPLDFHVTWVPSLGISSSACKDCAAIIEVLAENA